MELQVVLIGAVVFVVSAILIYLISAFTMKEKTFEEVIAEQKREQEEQMQKIKQEKKAEKETRKRFKPKGKDKKDHQQKSSPADHSPKVSAMNRSPKVSISEPDFKEPKMVNIELEPEIIEPVEPERPIKMSKKKDKPAKPILHNKDERTPVVSEEFVEEIVHRVTPKDDLELKHIHEGKHKKDKFKKQESEEAVVEEMMMATENRTQTAAPAMTESSIRVKESGGAKVISTVKAASLTDSEVQSLIEILLAKQGDSSLQATGDWNKKSQKGDPVAVLKKQLEEKDKALQEEQQKVLGANMKIKEIKQELSNEKVKFQALEKNFKEKMDYQGREVQALHTKIQHTHEQHLVETNQMRGLIQKLEAQVGDQSRFQRIVDENNSLKEMLAKIQAESLSPAEAASLKQKVSILEKELSNNALKLNASENTKRTLEQKLATKETELKKYESQHVSNEQVLEKRLDEVGQEMRKLEAKNSSLTKDLHSREQAVTLAQKECEYLKTKLHELEQALTESDQSTKQMEEKLKVADRQKIDTEGNLKNLQKKVESLDQEKSTLLTEIQALKQENSNLSTELKTVQEKAQTSENVKAQQNGDLHAEVNTVPKSEHEHILQEKIKEIITLSQEIDTKDSELSSMKQELETQKKKNNELREKNWKAMDALEKSEKLVSQKVQSAIKEKSEALLASQSEIETFDKSVMQRLFPDVSVKDKQSHKDWMSEFEKQASSHLQSEKQHLSSAGDNSAKLEGKIKELETATSELEKKLNETQALITQLENQLAEAKSQNASLQNQLIEAQSASSVPSNKLEEYETEISELKSHLEESEQKYDSLTSSLEEANTSCEKLRSQVTQYRNVLSETENKLTQLENSVEAEEKKWLDRLQAKDLELQQAQQEISSCKEAAMKAASSQEMKDRISYLELELSTSQGQRAELESQLKEAENKVTIYNTQIVELKQSSASITVLTTEVEGIKKQFEEEKKRNKDLASEIVKLKGIIKTGHDALTQEQNLVKKLQEQLTSTANNNSNGVPNDANAEVNQTSSQSSLTDTGTSV